MNDWEMNGQQTFIWPKSNSYALADFIVTDANELAFDHVNNHGRWASSMALITGPAKCGKTHLAHVWAGFTNAAFATTDMLEKFATIGGDLPVVVEDVDRIGYDEAALFHFLTQSIRDNRRVLMTARTPVSAWPFATDDVKSRARLAASFKVFVADDLALCQMFAKLFDDRQIVVDPTVISYLVARMERSADEVFTLAEILDKLALTQGRAISMKVAAEALKIRGAHFERLNSEI